MYTCKQTETELNQESKIRAHPPQRADGGCGQRGVAHTIAHTYTQAHADTHTHTHAHGGLRGRCCVQPIANCFANRQRSSSVRISVEVTRTQSLQLRRWSAANRGCLQIVLGRAC